MLDLEEIRGRKKATTANVPVVLDPEWGAEVAALQEQATKLPAGSTTLAEAEKELTELLGQADEKVATFKFRGISTDRYERLVAAHPTTAEQRAAAKRAGSTQAFNPKTFPPALIAACCADPAMTETQAVNLWEDDEWPKAVLEEMFHTALGCCVWRPSVTLP